MKDSKVAEVVKILMVSDFYFDCPLKERLIMVKMIVLSMN